MAIEFEPTEWKSKCGRYDIDLCETGYNAYEQDGSGWLIDSELGLPTFSAAVAWCEERAKQQQGGQSNV